MFFLPRDQSTPLLPLRPQVAHQKTVMPALEYQMAHGSSKFAKPEKIAAMKRMEKHSPPGL